MRRSLGTCTLSLGCHSHGQDRSHPLQLTWILTSMVFCSESNFTISLLVYEYITKQFKSFAFIPRKRSGFCGVLSVSSANVRASLPFLVPRCKQCHPSSPFPSPCRPPRELTWTALKPPPPSFLLPYSCIAHSSMQLKTASAPCSINIRCLSSSRKGMYYGPSGWYLSEVLSTQLRIYQLSRNEKWGSHCAFASQYLSPLLTNSCQGP